MTWMKLVDLDDEVEVVRLNGAPELTREMLTELATFRAETPVTLQEPATPVQGIASKFEARADGAELWALVELFENSEEFTRATAVIAHSPVLGLAILAVLLWPPQKTPATIVIAVDGAPKDDACTCGLHVEELLRAPPPRPTGKVELIDDSKFEGLLIPFDEQAQPVFARMHGSHQHQVLLFTTETKLRSFMERADLPFSTIKRINDAELFLQDLPSAIGLAVDPHYTPKGTVRYTQVHRG